MPIYEYKCQSCGKTFEVIQKFADDPLKTHPECGGEVDRLFSAPAFHLKGTGWYATDYAKTKTTEAKPDGSKSDGSKSESKTESTKDESKPAADTGSSGSETTSKTAESKPAATETKPSNAA